MFEDKSNKINQMNNKVIITNSFCDPKTYDLLETEVLTN